MGKRIKNYQKLHNANLFVRIAAVVAFLGVAGIVTVTAFEANREVEGAVIANGTGTPKAWDMTETTNIAANSSLAAEVMGKKYIQYTAKVANANSGAEAYVTHMASYLSADGEADGFMTLSEATLEYSYTPNDDKSWKEISLTEPSRGKNAFKLSEDILLGAAGTKSDAVYFRYYLVPKDNKAETVNDKVSFALKNSAGETGYTTSTATVAYKDAVEPAAIATTETTGEGTTDPTDASNAYTAPLGQSSFVPEIETVAGTVASVGVDSNTFLTFGVVMMVVGVLVFAICLAVYLPLSRY